MIGSLINHGHPQTAASISHLIRAPPTPADSSKASHSGGPELQNVVCKPGC